MRHTAYPALVYRALRLLPPLLQKRIVFRFAPKVSLGVSAVIWDASYRVLLLHHTYRRPTWGFPSGLVGRGEEAPAALVRELAEELGARAVVVRLLHAQGDPLLHHLTLYYSATLLDMPHCDGREIDAFRFVSLPDLPAHLEAATPSWLVKTWPSEAVS